MRSSLLLAALPLAFCLAAGTARLSAATPPPDEVSFRYRIGKVDVDPRLNPNGENLSKLERILGGPQASSIQRIDLRASSSPDGPFYLNERYARERAESLIKSLSERFPSIPASVWRVEEVPEDWDGVADYLRRSTEAYKNEAAQIVRSNAPNRKELLQDLYAGEAWDDLYKYAFPWLRAVKLRIIYSEAGTPEPVTPPSAGRIVSLSASPLFFERSSAVFQPGFSGNAGQIAFIQQRIADGADSLALVSYASPEGTIAVNQSLSERRAAAVRDYLSRQTGIPAGNISVRTVGEDWDGFYKAVYNTFQGTNRDEVLRILGNTAMGPDAKENAIKRLDGGRTWQSLIQNQMADLRRVEVQCLKAAPKPEKTVVEQPVEPVVPVVEAVEEVQEEEVQEEVVEEVAEEVTEEAVEEVAEEEVVAEVIEEAAEEEVEEVAEEEVVAEVIEEAAEEEVEEVVEEEAVEEVVEEVAEEAAEEVAEEEIVEEAAEEAQEEVEEVAEEAAEEVAEEEIVEEAAEEAQEEVEEVVEEEVVEEAVEEAQEEVAEEVQEEAVEVAEIEQEEAMEEAPVVVPPAAPTYSTVTRYKPLAGVTTNLVYDALTAFNVGLELPFGRHWSVTADAFYNNMPRSENRLTKLLMGDVGVNYYLNSEGPAMKGWFALADIGGGVYNLVTKKRGFDGKIYAVTFGAGYAFQLGPEFSPWRLKLGVGFGPVSTPYNYSERNAAGNLVDKGSDSFTWGLPVNLQAKVVYLFQHKVTERVSR